MNSTRMKKGVAGALLAGGMLAVSVFTLAAPAQAHSNFDCAVSYLPFDEGARLECWSASTGDKARLVISCRRIAGGSIATKYSGFIGNGSIELKCSSGYEIVGKQGQIIYADGHSRTVY